MTTARRYISNAADGSGLPRYGERDELCDEAVANGYEVYYTGKESDPQLWFVKAERFVGMADVIHISRLFTVVEWSKLSQKFRRASAAER